MAETKSTAGAAGPAKPSTGTNPVSVDKDAVAAAHEQRVTVPGASNVDARLDNRGGADRPKLEKFPAKPQQVDGPDVMHQLEHTKATLNQDALGNDVKASGDRKGMFSPGAHGLSDDEDNRPLKAN